MSHRLLTPLAVACLLIAPIVLTPLSASGQDEVESKPVTLKKDTFSALRARSIGPALMSGRVGDFAVNPDNPSHYFAAVC